MLRLLRPDSPAAALGLAVSYLMTKPAFARLAFGDFSRILVGQINRRHFCFAVDGAGHVQGFLGWALASDEHAQAWAQGRRALTFEDSRHGDCVVVNAFSADSTAATRCLINEARRLLRDKTALYFKRHYKNGATRTARVPVNAFIDRHIERNRIVGPRVERAATREIEPGVMPVTRHQTVGDRPPISEFTRYGLRLAHSLQVAMPMM
jgi:hemolysin-activating ACP:hemolysin acyltransferase